MSDEHPEPTEEELEQRLQKLLGEAETADADELDEIELKLKSVEQELAAHSDERKSTEASFDAEFEERIEKIRSRAAKARDVKPGGSREPRRRFESDRSVSGGSAVGLAFAVGYAFVGPVVAGIVIGLWCDHWQSGTWTIVGLGIGTAAAFFLLIRLVNRLNDTQR